MNITPVDALPKKRTDATPAADNKPLRNYFKEFMKMDATYARVDFAAFDYCSMKSAYVSLGEAVKRTGLPIKVIARGGNIYLVRTDKED